MVVVKKLSLEWILFEIDQRNADWSEYMVFIQDNTSIFKCNGIVLGEQNVFIPDVHLE